MNRLIRFPLSRRRVLLTATSMSTVALALPSAARAQAPTGDAAPLVLATSTPGGGFALYGETLARLVNAHAGGERLRAQPTRGTEENLPLLREGKVDAALIQGTSAGDVLQAGASQPLRILLAMYPSPGLLAVPRASSARRLEDLVGQPVVFGVRSSGLVTLARQVLGALDLDIDRDFQALYVDRAADSPKLVIDGKARGLWGAGEGWPGFVQLAQSPGGARFLAPSAQQIPRILARYPLLKPMELPAGTYPGIDATLPTVGSMNFILVREDLPLERAQRLLAAIQAVAPAWAAALPQARFSTLETTRASAPSEDLLHAAVRSR
ncbi:TAXI family TRAP transporter solute-binding subunit [Roseateles amylovorans]|uniref:TAXI family TRAP transporter solute-binding subunit n=1 Tax=Roseateles amylovorans TaxID=2978473 RepID=A0ABY6B7L7_9BURK|nr:TAXI family TRAP transporter solute-binding subunit [Roseateles amylovorans]UXH79941.1 TAXI family TRAP transporter solute-binding subunit [Roseateles amylovorans]